MTTYALICPFCLHVFLFEGYPGDVCPECDIGILIALEEYMERQDSLLNKEEDIDDEQDNS